MKKYTFFILVALLLYLFFSFDSLNRHLEAWKIKINLSGFKMTNFSKQELEVKRGETIIKISKTLPEDHQKFIDDKKFLLSSLFEPTTSPYPEVITNIIECPQEFKPKAQAVPNGTIYTLFAGERFNFGICSQDLVKYYSSYAIFDCRQKGVFEVILLSKEREEVKLVQTFAC